MVEFVFYHLETDKTTFTHTILQNRLFVPDKIYEIF